MSYEWQSLRRSSNLGPKSGLSLTQSQQILRMHEMKQKSRRVSLNAYSIASNKSGLTQDLAPIGNTNSATAQTPTLETLSNNSLTDTVQTLQSSPLDVICVTQDSTTAPKSRKPSKGAIGLSEAPIHSNHCNTNTTSSGSQSVVNNSYSNCVNSITNNISINSGITTTSALSTAMLPIISYDNIVMSRPSMDMNGRMSRRSSKSTAESFTCSQQSILSAMDRFVKAVNNMDSTVLVPSKLRDMDMPSAKLVRIPPALANTDLHSFYLMLNDVKKELLWGPGTAHNPSATLIPLSGRSSPRDLKHVRQPSDDSLGSMGSTASSSSDQDTDSEADSLMTDRDSIDEHTSHLAAAFRHHLQGLHTILHQLADSADYLCSRYQEDIDASSL